MNQLKITFKGSTSVFTYPEEWKECTPAQFKAICRWMSSKKASIEHILSALIITKSKFRRPLTSGEEYGLVETLKWTKDAPHFVNSKLPRLGLFHGPKDGLTNLTFEQLGLADQEFNRWTKAIAEDDMDLAKKHQIRLASVLYRPWPFRFNKRLADFWAFFIKILYQKRLLEISYNFWGMRSWLSTRFHETFSGEGDGSTGFGWPGLIVGVAGAALGTPRQVSKTECHLVLIHLEQHAIEAKKAEQRLKNQKR